MSWSSIKREGDACSACEERKLRFSTHVVQRLETVNGALVCRQCDVVAQWPTQVRP